MSKNIMANVTEYLAIKNEIKKKEARVKELQENIIAYLNGDSRKIIGQYDIKNTLCKKETVRVNELKEKNPELAKQLINVTEYYRLTIN